MISKNIKRVLKILPIIAMAPVVIANSPWKHSEKEKTPKKIKTEQVTKIKEDTPTSNNPSKNSIIKEPIAKQKQSKKITSQNKTTAKNTSNEKQSPETTFNNDSATSDGELNSETNADASRVTQTWPQHGGELPLKVEMMA